MFISAKIRIFLKNRALSLFSSYGPLIYAQYQNKINEPIPKQILVNGLTDGRTEVIPLGTFRLSRSVVQKHVKSMKVKTYLKCGKFREFQQILTDFN